MLQPGRVRGGDRPDDVERPARRALESGEHRLQAPGAAHVADVQGAGLRIGPAGLRQVGPRRGVADDEALPRPPGRRRRHVLVGDDEQVGPAGGGEHGPDAGPQQPTGGTPRPRAVVQQGEVVLVQVDDERTPAQPGHEQGGGDDVRVEGEQHPAAGAPGLRDRQRQPRGDAARTRPGPQVGAAGPVAGGAEREHLHAQPGGPGSRDLAVQPGVGDVVSAADDRDVRTAARSEGDRGGGESDARSQVRAGRHHA